ncbi:hypothetical protein [Catellatospora coxensis]|uniref:Uncharacterized protein n=1 Tax=Catellatospora coxensis TaxID=310354 RepID=A0A8J3KQ05_9ACTN|nr:hypothetical protein [Catellatospora coxensis]GIG05075.1 hypothetical protein Cco03nite_17750 [Catellatospora coxensis]
MTTVNPGPYRKVTGLWFALFCLLFLAVGVSGIYVGESTNGFWEGHKGAQTFIENLGGFIVAAVVLGIVWELVGKRAFLQEILATTGLANDVERTGLLGAGVDFTNSPNWGELFRHAQRLDLFFIYGRTWRNTNRDRLAALASKRNAHIRVFLPNPDRVDLLRAMAERMDMDATELGNRIREARADFEQIGRTRRGSVEVRYYDGDIFYSFYKFDRIALLVMTKHRRERTQSIPYFLCREGGTLFDFIKEELEMISRHAIQPP